MKSFFEKYRDYPLEVTIETTGKCNARCIFCPHNELERKNDYMSDELFLRIIEQLEEIPKSHTFYISPFKVNEFLMDKKIFERITLINERLRNAYIRLFTNFNLTTVDNIRQIANIKNLSDIDISLNSMDSEEYKAIMGLNLDRTLENIMLFLSHIKQNGLPRLKQPIVLSRVSQSPESDRKYIEDANAYFSDYLSFVTPIVIPRYEWIDYIPSEAPLNQDKCCTRWADINICCNGLVAFCCMDGRPAYPLGDVNKSSVLEIYNAPDYRKLRVDMPPKSQVTPCCNCSQ